MKLKHIYFSRTNPKDFWTPIRCQMFALNTFLESKSLPSYRPNIPLADWGWDWLLMEPGCLAESNIITIFAFVFTQPQNCIKPQLYFYFFCQWEVATKYKTSSGFMPRNIPAKLPLIAALRCADHLTLTGGNQIFASSSFPASSGHMMKEFHVIWYLLIGLRICMTPQRKYIFLDFMF